MRWIKGAWAFIAAIVIFPSILSSEVKLRDSGGVLEYHIEIPEYEIRNLEGGEVRLMMRATTHANPGYPRLPALTYTFALPPGTEARSVEVEGERIPIEGKYMVEARKPLYPISGDSEIIQRLDSLYYENRQRVYSGMESLPGTLGRLQATYEQREYSLVTVAVYPFSFDPQSQGLSYAGEATVRIHYEPASEEHSAFISGFLETGATDSEVPGKIFNKAQARDWYCPQERLLSSPGMIILTVEKFLPCLEDYVSWRERTGFNVRVVTKQEIEASSVDGLDLEQRIRNWLRENAAGYNYLFIIAHHWEIPMRILSSFGSEDPYQNSRYYPHPSDIYYGDLSRPDSESWDINGDGYYGQVASNYLEQGSMDIPDLGMELHVGRFNAWEQGFIEDYTERLKTFESSEDSLYKIRSVLAASILFYYSDGKYDGASIMEDLTNNDILEDLYATRLYEKEGEDPSSFECDYAFTNSALVSALGNNDAGVFVEFNHGSSSRFARCVWYDENEDDYPQDRELEYPLGLSNGDCDDINRDKPNTSFLISCLCGAPDQGYPLSQRLIDYGSVGTVAQTRVAFGGGYSGVEGLFYSVLDNYLAKPEGFDYVLGDAVDAGRASYWEQEGPGAAFNAYGHALYGDPALRHFGRQGSGVAEDEPVLSPVGLRVDTDYNVRFTLSRPSRTLLEVWDAAGRKVETLFEGTADAGSNVLDWGVSDLSSGSYFITLRTENGLHTTKTVVVR
ncbi:T9SS type A sorting domain-containing protein [candidate division WOR-3 bacterium]|uniref:T9SS type A sorting domain-containing protein n=1 Tax=candidate division WOR-3 bacterium TaxID=2052148 RepID=A0A9D5K7V5_UNCW3|nr:T9SS type A sorting domain-containing protein [candidate division WOR-3 bacterium]MBD3363961.1 T9SS type A sorting domain-containing protein [candidate division WOR-3 bacterium]